MQHSAGSNYCVRCVAKPVETLMQVLQTIISKDGRNDLTKNKEPAPTHED